MESVGGAVMVRSRLDPKLEPDMVEREIDAARALAGMALEESDPKEKERKDGGEAKVAEPQGGENKHTQKKTEKPKNGGSTSQPLIGRRGKQNLTEAEREAKMLQRILANRESARQTILKRQALREVLAREVAILSFENQHMKMEKEIAKQEFLSLKETNRKLKEQLTWVCMSQAGAQYRWGPCSPRLLNYTRIHLPSSGTECYEEKQYLPNGFETDVSCSLTLGLETKTKTKMSVTKLSHDKFVTGKTSAKESNVVKVSPSVKVAAEARRKRREIIKLKQMHRS